MSKIRTIKPEFCTSEQVVECSIPARLLFVTMWMFCDDQGIHPAKPKTLKMECFPGDDFTTEDVGRMVDELVSQGLLRRYSAENEGFLQVTGWRHQRIDRSKRLDKWPPPPEGVPEGESYPTRPDPTRPDPTGLVPKGNPSPGGGAVKVDETEPIKAPHPATDPITTAFDEARVSVFGETQRRPYPNATDVTEAQAMRETGATVDTLQSIFRTVFEGQKANGDEPAGMLRYMRKPVERALRVGNLDTNGQLPSRRNKFENPSATQHRTRVELYWRNIDEGKPGDWLEEHGPEPTERPKELAS